MVRESTYYKKFTPSPIIDLTGYAANWKLLRNSSVVDGYSGNLLNNGSYFEVSFQTSLLPRGLYQVQAFLEFPDGFIENFLNETIIIE